MTEEVLLTIRGLQSAQDMDAEPVEFITTGKYYRKNNRHYILYDEWMEGFQEPTRNMIKLSDDALDITKKGVANVHMLFEENKKNVSCYNTPYGDLIIGILASKVQVQETDNNIDVDVKYALEANDEHLADYHITMNIKSKNA